MAITILGDVKTIVKDNHGEMYFDNAKKVVNGDEQKQPDTQNVLQVEDVELVNEMQENNVVPKFFRIDSQSISKIQAKWNEALENRTKTGVIRFVKELDHSNGFFKFGTLTYDLLAEEFNKAQNKYIFKPEDFENANKPLKK